MLTLVKEATLWVMFLVMPVERILSIPVVDSQLYGGTGLVRVLFSYEILQSTKFQSLSFHPKLHAAAMPPAGLARKYKRLLFTSIGALEGGFHA